MTEINSLLLLVIGELLVVASLLAIGMVVFTLMKRRRDRNAALKLVAAIKADEERRSEETRSLLAERFGLDGEQLEAVAKSLGREEKRFYQTVINFYLKREASALENLHIAFEGATEPYRTLELPQPSGEETETADSADSDQSAEISRLQDENERLSEELRVTMDTIGRMLNEYASMYSGGDPDELDKEKLKKMFEADAREQQKSEEDGGAQTEAAPEPSAGTVDESSVEPEASAGGAEEEAVALAEEPDEPSEPLDETLVLSDEELASLDDLPIDLPDDESAGNGEKG